MKQSKLISTNHTKQLDAPNQCDKHIGLNNKDTSETLNNVALL